MKIFKSQKHVFWQALLITILVFSIGIFFGFVIESWRTSRMQDLYLQAELNLLDIRIQNDIYSLSGFDCDKAIEENIKFADKIYEEAKTFKKYEDAERFSESIILQHKRYDLLRTLFWVNSIKIKKECKADYHNIVYVYNLIDPDLESEAKQKVFSRILEELKERMGNKLMLIPIAGDTGLTSIGLLMAQYEIKSDELPVILIDEKVKVNNIESVEEIEDKIEGIS